MQRVRRKSINKSLKRRSRARRTPYKSVQKHKKAHTRKRSKKVKRRRLDGCTREE